MASFHQLFIQRQIDIQKFSNERLIPRDVAEWRSQLSMFSVGELFLVVAQ